MAAPKGNQFWKLRSKHGRDKIFKDPETMLKAAYEYFEWCTDNPITKHDVRGKDADNVYIEIDRPFTMAGLCIFLDVNTLYFSQFEEGLKENEKDFSLVITHIKEVIKNKKFEGAAAGIYNANIIARDLGLKEQSEIKTSVDIDPKKWV